MERPTEAKFSSPEEEIAFLKNEIAQRERELLSRNVEIDHADHETIGKQVMREYAEHDPSVVLHENHMMQPHDMSASKEFVSTSLNKVDEVLRIAEEKGIRNALSILEKLKDSFLTDEVHKTLVQKLRNERVVADLNPEAPLFKVLDMSLFEISLPRNPDDSEKTDIETIMSAMEQFYAGMQSIALQEKGYHYALEIAVSDKRDDIIFYVAVPNEYVDLFEKHALSLFPHAVLVHQQNDYNIFVDGGEEVFSVAYMDKHSVYPLKTHKDFGSDPLAVLLNAFSKIERDGGGASIQILVGGGASRYEHMYKGIVKRIEDGLHPDIAIRKSTIGGEILEGMRDLIVNGANPKEERDTRNDGNTIALEAIREKLTTPTVGVNIRLAVSAKEKKRAEQIMTELESTFLQFQNMRGNKILFDRYSGSKKQEALRQFSFREFSTKTIVPLSFTELASLVHFPSEGIESSPQFKQSRAKHAPAPVDMPTHGTLLGENDFRNIKKKIFLTPEDRLRHFYVIGQTGTGKTTLLKNMIIQDIQNGAGVCMIDPHGTDIVDVLSGIPPERMDDVIYFDPSNMDTVIGLNMLEYDERFPEQKTFVVNELFSIFQKLYGANPESMGPMFEQYFRNSTLLVLEDPESGSTLLDISRVMADADYRAYKLSRAKNPVVVQFWTTIATKAGGEASLENIVPYIVSKFDVFTANDYMRPIIGQQKSSFKFRDVMDSKKILLVNLSKGRLGEINANLIGMIIVGKILMAALSRVDDTTKGFPPFYLYIDEFQNVTTNSISAILSEARKYKLGLTVAHQFIAQLEDDIRDAVFGNVGSIAAFRVGTEDAESLARQFEPIFTASDLMNIENKNAYLRILADGSPTTPFSMRTMKPNETDMEYAQQMIEYSTLKYGTARDVVDAEIRARYLA